MDQSEDRDREIVERVLGGETEAFEELVERWHKPLISLAYRFCQDRARAEDMAQDAFLHLYQRLERWERRELPFSSWMFTVAANLYRSQLRRRGPVLTELGEQAEQRLAAPEQPGLAEEERAELVRRAVATLPPKYRDVLVLFYFHEKSVTETAATLSVREGTIKARLHRGRALLEKKLDQRLSVPEMPVEEPA